MANVTMYTYRAPFTVEMAQDKVPDYLSSEDREYESELKRICFQFAVKHRLIVPSDTKDQNYIQPSIVDVNNWVYAVNWMNMRSLVDPAQFQSLINRLLTTSNDSSTIPIELVIDLYTRLGCLFDHAFLDMIANRVIQSVTFIPYDTHPDVTPRTWEEIHIALPWLWCLIYVQTLIRTETMK